MSSLDALQKQVEDLSRRHKAAASKKAELKGRLEAKKQELVALGEEIRNHGYDPKNLKAEKERVEAELKAELKAFEEELTAVEQALAEIDKK